MKKLLSLMLVLAVVLSSMSFAFAAAPTDVAGDKYESSINKLIGLGVLNGYPDGTFKPTGNITRAEFAKVMVVALGYNDAAQASGDSKFADVADHWAKGYVNVASTLGIINGVGGGKFDPDSNVTFEQAVTMVVRSLGYEPAAKANGGYPVGYLTIASQKKITKDVSLVAGLAANRSVVAKLLDQALDVRFMVQEGYGTLTTFKESDNKDDILLAKGLKLTKAEDVIIDGYDTTAKTVKFTKDVDKKRQMTYVSPIDPTNTKNANVTIWYKDGVVYSFSNETTIKVDLISKVNDSDSDTKTFAADEFNSVTLKLDGGLYYTTNKLDVPVAPTVKKGDETVTVDSVNDASGVGLEGYYAKVYIKDNKVYRIEAFDLDNAGIIASASASEVKYQRYGDNDIYLSNIDNAADLLYVFVDGVQKTVSDLKADMYFESWVNSDGKKMVVAATTAKATGKLTTYGKDTATVGGTKYDVTGDNYATGTNSFVSLNGGTKYEKTSLEDLVGIDVTGYKNFAGKLAFVKGTSTSTSTDFYGLAKSFAQEGKSITVVKDVDGKSTEVTYSVKTDTDELKAAGSLSNISWNEFLGNMAGIGAIAGEDIVTDTDNTVAEARIYKFHINADNKIIQIDAVPFSSVVMNPANAKFDKDGDYILSNTGASKIYADAAKFFDLTENKVRYWSSIEGNAAGSADIAVNMNANGSDAEVVAFLTNSYSTVESEDLFYAHITAESFDGTYYNMTTSTGSALKLHKDDVTGSTADKYALKNADKELVTYIKDGDKIKVKDVTAAVYNTVTGEIEADYVIGSDATYAYGTMTKLDGNNIQINVANGDFTGFATGNTWFKLESGAPVLRVTFDGTSVDKVSISNKTSIPTSKKVLLVIVDDIVRGVYFMQ